MLRESVRRGGDGRERQSSDQVLPPHRRDLRQIPDNQEVLLSPSSDVTCIVEVLESVKEGAAKDDLEAALR